MNTYTVSTISLDGENILYNVKIKADYFELSEDSAEVYFYVMTEETTDLVAWLPTSSIHAIFREGNVELV